MEEMCLESTSLQPKVVLWLKPDTWLRIWVTEKMLGLWFMPQHRQAAAVRPLTLSAPGALYHDLWYDFTNLQCI